VKEITIRDWQEFFPFKSVRSEQEKAINFILNSFINERKRYVILQAGTGVGKSIIGVTVARYLNSNGGKTYDDKGEETTGSYVLTTQKLLQQQYMDDFGPTSGRNMMRSLKSSSNYKCRFYTDQSCAESRRLLKQLGDQVNGTEFHKCCKGNCPYVIDKQEFIEFPLGITNFSYFLAETMYAGQLGPRALLVIDEAHNIENELSRFIEVTFSERFARTVLGCRVPKLDSDAATFAWIKGAYRKNLLKHISDVKSKLDSCFNTDDSTGLVEHSKRHEMLDKHICKVNRFIESYNPDNWIMNYIKSTQKDKKSNRKFEFKPVDVSSFGYDHLYELGSRILMMSATIVDKDTFCKSVGVPLNEVSFLDIPSPFPKENRPIHYLGVGSMSMRCIDQTLPNIVSTIKDLLELHVKEKGIIHCVSYKIAQYIIDNVGSKRLLLHNSDNRDETIQFHKDSVEPTVLVSPSMTEGVDLADDVSRFQILCKVPYPYLGDKVIQLRKAKNQQWYACQTARTVIQALGRSVRNSKDHAVSYILDADWTRFYRENASMFPEEFSSALT
jgi:Rad3-related DNA helicase